MCLNSTVIGVYLFTDANRNYGFNVFAPAFTHLMGLLYRGGSVLIIEAVKSIIYRNEEKVELEELEKYLEDDDFFSMLQDYTNKEYSPENMIMLEKLNEIKRKNPTESNPRVSLADLNDIHNRFFKENAIYQINFSAKVKQDFNDIMNDALQKEVRLKQIKDACFIDLLENLRDPNVRLCQTQEYHKWLAVYRMKP